MVRLTKIYTKTGDDGTTGLGNASRVRKDDVRVEAYGTVDEANAALGLAAAAAAGHALAPLLASLQNDLFDVGADLCCPIEKGETPGKRLRITPAQTQRLEHVIDTHNSKLPTLNSFILPGGTELAARLHLARTMTRRAERLTVTLAAQEPAGTNPEAVKYLNRLSDLLFVLARVVNASDGGIGDVLWVPGGDRPRT